jgi:hypothetical protein
LPDFALNYYRLKKAFSFSILTDAMHLNDGKKIFFGVGDFSIAKRGSVVY